MYTATCAQRAAGAVIAIGVGIGMLVLLLQLLPVLLMRKNTATHPQLSSQWQGNFIHIYGRSNPSMQGSTYACTHAPYVRAQRLLT